MKKSILILCILCLFIVTSCSSETNTITENKNNVTESSIHTASTISPTSAFTPTPKEENIIEISSVHGVVSDYRIARTSFEKNSKEIDVYYPQIEGLSDTAKQEKINDLIRNKVLINNDFGINISDNDLSEFEFKIDYLIKWTSNNLLSVQFYGYYYHIMAPHPHSICTTINIDMKSGEEINLGDILNLSNSLVQFFIGNAKFFDGSLIPDDFKLAFFTPNNLEYTFREHAPFYFTSKGIVFTVEVAHQMGDYDYCTLNYSDITYYLKQEGKWDNIKTDFPATNYQIIREHCFNTDLPGFGDTWFASGFEEEENGVIKVLKFYLLDNNNDIKYTFPDFKNNELGYHGVRTVSFKDVNNDGNKDVIIIAILYKDTFPESNEVKVYLYDKNGFKLDNEFNNYLNTTLKDPKSVSDVLDASRDYY